jgi:hypothetical protein
MDTELLEKRLGQNDDYDLGVFGRLFTVGRPPHKSRLPDQTEALLRAIRACGRVYRSGTLRSERAC